MRATDFSKIAASAPLDKTASIVRDGHGEHYDPSVTDGRLHWDVQPAFMGETGKDSPELRRVLGRGG